VVGDPRGGSNPPFGTILTGYVLSDLLGIPFRDASAIVGKPRLRLGLSVFWV